MKGRYHGKRHSKNIWFYNEINHHILFKRIFDIYWGRKKIVEVLNTEIPTLNGKTRYLDFLYRLDDGSICNIEFEFPVAYSHDLERFFDYNIVVEINEGEITDTIVINFKESGYGSTEIEIGNSKSFHPKNVYLGDIDYLAELEKIKKKVNLDCNDLEKINKDRIKHSINIQRRIAFINNVPPF